MLEKRRVTLDANEASPRSPIVRARSSRFIRSRPPPRWESSPTRGRPRDAAISGARSRGSSRCNRKAAPRALSHGALQAGALAHDVHGVAGAAAHDPQHVQDRRRADALRDARGRAHARDARAVDLRRPLRRDGLPPDGICAARFRLGPGGAGLRGDRPCRDPLLPDPVPAFLRRVPHLARGRQDRGARRRRARRALDSEDVAAHRRRALTPDRPVLRGTAQNPDAFFQAREAANPFYLACPDAVARAMGSSRQRPGAELPPLRLRRRPRGHTRPRAHGLGRRDRARDGRLALRARREGRRPQGPSLSPVRRRALRRRAAADRRRRSPFSIAPRSREPSASRSTRTSSPPSASRAPAVRCRESSAGGTGSPPRSSRRRWSRPSSKSFRARRRRTTSPSASPTTSLTPRCRGTPRSTSSRRTLARPSSTGSAPTERSEPTATRSRSSARRPTGYAQGYFVYDSKKAGAMTVSHLRFGPRPIRSAYLIARAHFVACHQFEFLHRYDILEHALPGAAFLLNSPYGPDEVWDRLPREVQEQMLREADPFLRHRRLPDRARCGPEGPHQHDHADLLLRDHGAAPAGAGDRADQEGGRGDVREEGRRGPAAQLRRDRRHARRPLAGARARPGDGDRTPARRRARRRRRTSSNGSRP